MRRGAKAEGPVGNEGWWEGLMRVRKIAEKMKIRMEEDSSCWIEVQETDKSAGEKDEIISGRYLGMVACSEDGVLVRGAIGLLY